MKKKKTIPFSWMPGSWGLKGTAYARAEAMYYFDGAELEEALLALDFKPGTIEYDIRKTEIDFQQGKITERDMKKTIATLKGESWVEGDVVHTGDGGVFFDLDWNHIWIEELRQNGYTGGTEEEIMKKWFTALCYSEIIDEGGEGIDPFLYESARTSLNRLMNRSE